MKGWYLSMRGSRGGTRVPDPPPEKSQNTGFHSNTDGWRFADGPIVARFYMLAGWSSWINAYDVHTFKERH